MATVADPSLDLIEANLAAPSVRPGTVAKTAAVEPLCASTLPFATIVAPAGYGKTTLLAQWAEADPRPFAWVALDSRTDDAVLFMRYIAAALNRVEPLPPTVFDALGGLGGSNWTTRVPRLGSALTAVERPLVLVLDDLHTVTNPDCLDVLAALREHVPAGSQIAVAAREEPALPLARWRVEGRLHEVGASDLRLDESEAKALLRGAGVSLDPDDVADLTARTEGWPAGLYLAALSLKAGPPEPARSAAFSGDDRLIVEYFQLELLHRLPEDEALFLMRTSVLDSMCGALCDAVLETTGSAARLASLARSNGFIVPLDRRDEWYRYHHLFGEILRRELARREPEGAAALNARAMAWCVANGRPEAAVRYGQAAGETAAVATLVDQLSQQLYYGGRMETLERWLAWFDEDDLARFPALAVFGAWFRALTGRSAEAERWLRLADGAVSVIPLSDGSDTIEPWVANLRAYMMADGVERALADVDRALALFAPRSDWRANAELIRGVAQALLGLTHAARVSLAAAIESGLGSGAVDDVFVAQAELALLAARDEAWDEAGRYARAAQVLVREAGLDDYSTSAIVHVATARVLLHEGRHADARAALARVHRLRPMLDHAFPWFTVQVGLELARAHLALGEASAARAVFAETEAVIAVRPGLGSLVEDALVLRERLVAATGPAGSWAMSMTGAELRLLPYLATHLTFPEIGARLFISRNTVKTEALAIYRKLGASSRGRAIERAVEVGLLESSVYPPRVDLTQGG